MAAVEDVDQVLAQWHPASDEFLKGNPEPTQKLFSHREDVTLANPYGPAAREIGPVAHGGEQVSKTQEHAASRVRTSPAPGPDPPAMPPRALTSSRDLAGISGWHRALSQLLVA